MLHLMKRVIILISKLKYLRDFQLVIVICYYLDTAYDSIKRKGSVLIPKLTFVLRIKFKR